MKISLKAARINAGLTQLETCEKLGISPATLIRWEKGHKRPKPIDLMGLANLYGVHVDSFFLESSST